MCKYFVNEYGAAPSCDFIEFRLSLKLYLKVNPYGKLLICRTHPKVVIVTMVYQNAAGMDVKLVPYTFFSA